MRTRFCLSLVLLALFLSLSPGLSQSPSNKGKSKEPKPLNEDEKIRDGIKEALKVQETERDKLLKELQKLPRPQNSAGGSEFGQWFEALAAGRDVWVVPEKSKTLRELFQRMADRLGVTGDQITREQFLRYAQQYLTAGSSPSWKPPSESGHRAEVLKAFRQLDRDGDGLLSSDELSDALRAERSKWDVNHDGFIDLQEYTAYFEGRMQQVISENGGLPPSGKKPNSLPPHAREEGMPLVYRYGQMASELPPWFTQFDTDWDGQLGLYEWRYTGWPLELFEKMDRNNDGFLTAEEVLRYLRANASPGDPSKVKK